MFTARHFEKTAQVVSTIEDNQVRYEQTMLWEKIFIQDSPRFKPDKFERRVEFLHLHKWEFDVISAELGLG